MANSYSVVETSVIRRSHDLCVAINQYELLYHLGSGMHGRVMLARNSTTGEHVAIKSMRRIDPRERRLPRSTDPNVPAVSPQQETEAKIRKEIAIMKKCSHRNLVRLLEVIDDPSSRKVYLVMEHLAGGEVLWRTKDEPPVPVLNLDQVQRIMRDVTLGLEYLHHQGIIHRDIKPANLLWTEGRKSVKICDFGVSCFSLPTDGDESGLSKTVGSPSFFAPEICENTDKIINKRIDIWALGVTFYCLLFGAPPWLAEHEIYLFHCICNNDFKVPSTMAADHIPTGGREYLPEGREIGWCVVDLLSGLLEKNPDKRLSLVDVKQNHWIQTGMRDPERWLRETAPGSQPVVTVTDQDTRDAIRIAWYSPSFKNIRQKIRSSLPTFSRSRSRSVARRPAQENAVAGPSTTNVARSSADRRSRRFAMFSSALPSRANTVPNQRRYTEHMHSDPPSTSPSFVAHQQPFEALGPQAASRPVCRSFFVRGVASSPNSPTASPTTLSDDSAQHSGIRSRLLELLRQRSSKVKKKRSMDCAEETLSYTDGYTISRYGVRSSADTFDSELTRSSLDSARLSARSASWAGGGASADEDGGSSGTDPTLSVIALGAGGYADRPPPPREVKRDLSRNGTPTPRAPDISRRRQMSPLAQARYAEGRYRAHSESDYGTEEVPNGMFDDANGADSSDDEDVLELRSRRPSAVLPRSANTSPRR